MRRILAADDDEVARLILERAFAGLPEVSATVVEDGAVLLEILDQAAHPPDLVVLDLHMPRCGGREVARRLRERGMQVPVLVASAGLPPRPADRADAHCWLAKPYTVAQIRGLAAEMLGLPPPGGDRHSGADGRRA